jgi:MoaA/NifB/PqqE/SkfB family radical SAM enzyme
MGGTALDNHLSEGLQPRSAGLDFLWLELTAQCNLRCTHCYADAEPAAPKEQALSVDHYLKTLADAAALGCRKVQFIGGEPTMYPGLSELIREARRLGFDFVEVFTNGVTLTETLFSTFVENSVSVAVSFYARDPAIHDSITKHPGSHAATLRTIQRVIDAGLPLRAGVITMPANSGSVEETVAFLKDLGVGQVGVDQVRSFGRGQADAASAQDRMSQLCGSCWQGSLTVFPDGSVAPCIMSRTWPVGSVLDKPLAEIVHSNALGDLRAEIYEKVWKPKQAIAKELAAVGSPSAGDCDPQCTPRCSPSCSPCFPYGKCQPQLLGQ